MLAHLNKCAAVKEKGDKADGVLRELKTQGLSIPVEPAWQWWRLDLAEVVETELEALGSSNQITGYISKPHDYFFHFFALFQHFFFVLLFGHLFTFLLF